MQKVYFHIAYFSATDLEPTGSYLGNAHLFIIAHKNATHFTGQQSGFVHRWSHDQILVQSNVLLLATANMLHIGVVIIIIFLERTLWEHPTYLNVRHNLNSSHHWWTCKLHFMLCIYSTKRDVSFVV